MDKGKYIFDESIEIENWDRLCLMPNLEVVPLRKLPITAQPVAIQIFKSTFMSVFDLKNPKTTHVRMSRVQPHCVYGDQLSMVQNRLLWFWRLPTKQDFEHIGFEDELCEVNKVLRCLHFGEALEGSYWTTTVDQTRPTYLNSYDCRKGFKQFYTDDSTASAWKIRLFVDYMKPCLKH